MISSASNAIRPDDLSLPPTEEIDITAYLAALSPADR
jgi:hypothetical protein